MTGIELEDVHVRPCRVLRPESFAFFLKTKMDRVLTDIAGPGRLNNVVFEVLTVADEKGGMRS